MHINEASATIVWECQHFSQLTTIQLYDILRARNEVFVVEQTCPYQDCDDKDLNAWHLTAHLKNKLVAYTRILAPGTSFPRAASIGRVLTVPGARKKEIGKQLMHYSIQQCQKLYKNAPITIAAQLYLENFYMLFGFKRASENFLEDNIPHLLMDFSEVKDHIQ